VEKTDVNTAKDTGDKGCEICFSNDFPFLKFCEPEDVRVQECLVVRVELFLGRIKQMQQGAVVLAERRRGVAGYNLQNGRMGVR